MKGRSKRNILVTGGSGFIGSCFLQHIFSKRKGQRKFYSARLDYRIISPSHKTLNIANFNQVKKLFDHYTPEIVINFAAHRDANSAELQRGDREGSAWKTNVLGVENLIKMSQVYNTYIIHISTDMVFSGSSDTPGPYHEKSRIETQINKISWYGWTKAESERVLKKHKEKAIVRIGNVTQSIHDPKLDYIGKILYLFDNKKLYPLFHDQQLTLTYLSSLFETLEELIKKKHIGVFHVSSTNLFTPYTLAKYLIKNARRNYRLVKSTSIEKFLKNSPNRYPKYCGLLAIKTQKKLHVSFLEWEKIVDRYIANLKLS